LFRGTEVARGTFRITPRKKMLILNEGQKMLQKLLGNPRIIYFLTQFEFWKVGNYVAVDIEFLKLLL